MKTSTLAITIPLLLLISVFSIQATAQDNVPEVGWNMGWEDEDPAQTPTWTLSLSGQKEVEIWFDNRDPYPITINLDFDADDGVEIDMPESVDVGAQSNVSKTVTVENITVLDWLAGSELQITVIGQRANPVNGEDLTGDPTVEIEASLIVPRIADLRVSLSELGHPVSAGTSAELEVLLENHGNMRDKVVTPTLIANGCPQLTLSGLDEMKDKVVDSQHDGSKVIQATTVITLSPSSSHPSKKCSIELAIVSDGGGGTSIANVDVDIESSSNGGDSQTGTGENGDSNGGGSDGGASSGDGDDGDAFLSGNSLPAPSFILTILGIAMAVFIRHR